MHNPPLRLKGHSPENTPEHENLNRGRYQTLATYGFQARGPTLALNDGVQYSQFRIELNGNGINISQGTPANYELLPNEYAIIQPI
jgi:hypothetical protein